MEEENAKQHQADKRKPKASGKDDWLGEQLRELYDDYGKAPLPLELKDLLERLEETRGKGPDKS